jgi:hypothetical protein
MYMCCLNFIETGLQEGRDRERWEKKKEKYTKRWKGTWKETK